MIELKNIHKAYNSGENAVKALDGVSLVIEQGEFVAIMGPSGSGKSTLMHIIGLLDRPDTGSINIAGTDVTGLSNDELAVFRRNIIGFVFQQFNLLPRMSCIHNVMLPLLYSKETPDESSAMAILERLGLGERMGHAPNQLSIGQQQRVAIARALINSPKIILADEPTGNLDTMRANEIMAIFKELNARGITIVLVTHEEDIGRQARRMIRIRDGRIINDTGMSQDARLQEKEKVLGVHIQKKSKFHFLNPSETWNFFKEGFRSLKINKLRASLSMLGISIGVAAVVAMLALGKGAKQDIQQQLSTLGSNLLMLRPGMIRSGGAALELGAGTRLSNDDVKNIKERLPYVARTAGVVMSRAQIAFMNRNWNTQVVGVEPEYEQMHSLKPVAGRFFTEGESKSRALVALVGMTIVKEIFGGQNPVGEMIKLNQVNFRVIGVIPPRGSSGGWRDQDDIVIIPLPTAMYRLIGSQYYDYIDIELVSPDVSDKASEDVMDLMVSTHRIPVSQRDDAFMVWNMADIQNVLSQSSRTMSMLLAIIAAISLVVGGIGIMNIMFVSVTERTREIGLRKAVGARRFDILAQFLAESVVISTVGGGIGVVLGLSLIYLVALAVGWNVAVSMPAIILSLLFSGTIGIVFGIYPARKASLLDPIEALRYE